MATFGDRRITRGAVVVATAIPFLFLHVAYQPGLAVKFGSTTFNAYLSDFVVLGVVVAAVLEGARCGFAPLRRGRPLWIAIALFLLWAFIEVAHGHLRSASYLTQTHGVTAAKFAEYALLAPAVPLLLRTRRDLVLPLWSLALWSSAATVAGIAQFFGADILHAGTVGRRQQSFLSFADFAALSAAALVAGIVALARARSIRPAAALATVSGALGMIVAGAIASVLGLATALIALTIVLVIRRDLLPRRAAAIGAVALVVVVGAVAIRGGDLDAYARFLGATPGKVQAPERNVQTYSHRTLLAWLGWKIWTDDPLLGVGWQGSSEPASFEPHLAEAHRRFPDVSAIAFPSAAPDRRYGVQNSWIQSLADLGVVGFALWVSVFAVSAWLAARAALRDSLTGLYGLLAVAVLVWLWAAQGFVAGIPLDALTWLAVGLGVTPLVPE